MSALIADNDDRLAQKLTRLVGIVLSLALWVIAAVAAVFMLGMIATAVLAVVIFAGLVGLAMRMIPRLRRQPVRADDVLTATRTAYGWRVDPRRER